jgi:thiol-disulfide isomerase/thioredoxin
MQLISRRLVLAAGTVATAAAARKPAAQEPELDPLGKALRVTEPPRPVPDGIVFLGANGAEHRLAEFRGHGMVINLWATWCAPCVSEMPALAILAKRLGPKDVAVLPLSSDRGGTAAVQRFYDRHDIVALPVLLDPGGAAARAWAVHGIPTTIIVDRDGSERARVEGAVDWASDEASAQVLALTGG